MKFVLLLILLFLTVISCYHHITLNKYLFSPEGRLIRPQIDSSYNLSRIKRSNTGNRNKGERYLGLYLGKLNTYSNQVSGDVYAVDASTLFIKSFFYDGLGQDTFFWAGSSIRPSNIGFIIPDEQGKTNVLQRYSNVDITIRLPEDKTLSSIKWLSVWNIRDNRNHGDIYIPEGFEPPSSQKVAELSQLGHGVQSDSVIIIDSKTVKIPEFSYDGLGEDTYFWYGTGPQPNPSGSKIPDERGYLETLGKYDKEDVILQLPGEVTIFDIDWISIWNTKEESNYGSILIPDSLNIPPSLNQLIKYESRLPNCEQLHKRLQVNWEIFGPQITIELVGQIELNDYIAFGLSGSTNSSSMVGADVSISYMKGHLGYTYDYNITDRFPCTNVLGLHKGVCPDTKVGGVDNYQIHLYSHEDGLTKLTFRRNLQNTDEGDKIFSKTEESYVVWAIGKYNSLLEPRMHYLYPKGSVKIHFGRKPAVKNCFPFAALSEHESSPALLRKKSWGPLRVFNQTLQTFYARIGVPGHWKGYSSFAGIGSPGLVWYINGLMTPTLYVKRGRTYTFRVEGGNNPHNAMVYHPLYITNDPLGGYIKHNEEARKNIHVYAGIEFDRKGRPTPTSSGRLCLWSYKSTFDARKSDSFYSFIMFRNSLDYKCDKGSPGLLQWSPNASTPDIVYYQSYTQRNMGGKIFVLDDFSLLNSLSLAAPLYHKCFHILIFSYCLYCYIFCLCLG